MAKSDARFEYRAKLSRESHDLSRPFGFTCAPGMLLPVFADYVSAGDYVKITHDLPFLRTMPLAAPAMVDVKIHFESFFVPAQMIYQPYENVMYSLKNLQSSAYGAGVAGGSQFPTFNYPQYISRFKFAAGVTYAHSYERAEAMRLADMLGLHGENFCEWTDTQTNCPWIQVDYSFFPWQILTYNTIFYYYYALDDKTAFYNQYCNYDKYYSNSFENSGTDAPIDFMKIHHRPWDFDYFTSAYRSPILGDNNMVVPTIGAGSYSDLSSVSTRPRKLNGADSLNNHDTANFGSFVGNPPAYADLVQSINTASIRQMFANEKLAMITGRTKKNFDSQVLAHLGVQIPHDVKHDISLIGHNTYELSVGEVTSLASTERSPLGELAGKGYASSRDERNSNQKITHDFKVPTDGFIMTIFSIEPLRRYFGGFERQNAISQSWDLPRPEFDRLGNQPMVGAEVGGYGVNVNDVYNWKERYYQWKRRAPKASLAFANPARGQGYNDFNSYMLVNRPYSENDRYTLSGIDFSYQIYPCRPLYEERFYIPWNCMDHLMLTSYFYGFLAYDLNKDENWDSMPWQLYQRDPFIVDCYPKVTKVSWMSKDGEPIYPF